MVMQLSTRGGSGVRIDVLLGIPFFPRHDDDCPAKNRDESRPDKGNCSIVVSILGRSQQSGCDECRRVVENRGE
jgi:hypothetical protein